MPNPFFKFKKFTIYQEKCAMKVGTDGVLLGAWADVTQSRRILDIGTGTGLIALMAAQRSQAAIVGIDIDWAAVEQAKENATLSPWKERIDILHQDVTTYHPEEKFDIILSNPPYFQENTFCINRQRNIARHTDGLSFDALLDAVGSLLADEGRFFVVLPTTAVGLFLQLAAERHLYPLRHTLVYTKPNVPSKRSLLALGKQVKRCHKDTLIIELERHVYSSEYIELTREFYLKM